MARPTPNQIERDFKPARYPFNQARKEMTNGVVTAKTEDANPAQAGTPCQRMSSAPEKSVPSAALIKPIEEAKNSSNQVTLKMRLNGNTGARINDASAAKPTGTNKT